MHAIVARMVDLGVHPLDDGLTAYIILRSAGQRPESPYQRSFRIV